MCVGDHYIELGTCPLLNCWRHHGPTKSNTDLSSSTGLSNTTNSSGNKSTSSINLDWNHGISGFGSIKIFQFIVVYI
jgi:hypothetical protein